MGYFFDGGFTGFLYSMKETGRKLANGAKELVEDFVSGFNGSGWKLWKRNGSWRLELDELLVRKSLTVYDMIISKISAIKGSQAITQANAKIKSVSIVDEADVYEEVNNIVYNENFLDPKWDIFAADGNVSVLEITENKITTNTYVDYEQGFRVENAKSVASFTIEVTKLSGKMAYVYIDEHLSPKIMFINHLGTYTLPTSYANESVGYKGFMMSSNTIFEITQTSYTNVISEKIVKKPCYRIEIEDDINSVLEYDLLRCQKADRYYYVQVGSVFQYYINIPVSEFEVDSEGNVATPPLPGDELIQIGNASYQEKYNNRHSAIYLHVEENEPIIDLMTDIYSKDWSVGNIIKTRIGGNLPYTDGDKGFYCVNGKLLFVDEIGQTISVINPDGSASFARGNISWTKDGIPEFKGYIISGNKDGKRIEINPEKGSIDIFDDESNIVNSIEGRKYLDQKEFFDSNTMNYVYNSSEVKKTISYAAGETKTDTFTIQVFTSPESGIKVNLLEQIKMLFSRRYVTSTNGFYNSLLVVFTLRFRNTVDGSILLLDKIEMTRENSNFTAGNHSYYISNEGYFIPEIEVTTTVVGGDSSGSISIGVLIEYAELIRIVYKSSFFSQGVALGDSPENSAMIWYKKKENWKRGQVFMNVENEAVGIKVNEDNVMVKTRTFTNMESHWLLLCPMVMIASINAIGTIYEITHAFNYEKFTCTREGVGIYRITWPTTVYEYLRSYRLFGIAIPQSKDSVKTGYVSATESYALVYINGVSGPINESFDIIIYAQPMFNGKQDDTD